MPSIAVPVFTNNFLNLINSWLSKSNNRDVPVVQSRIALVARENPEVLLVMP
jgi:hypothetical protein